MFLVGVLFLLLLSFLFSFYYLYFMKIPDTLYLRVKLLLFRMVSMSDYKFSCLVVLLVCLFVLVCAIVGSVNAGTFLNSQVGLFLSSLK